MEQRSISFALKLASDVDSEQRHIVGEVALLAAVIRTAIRDWLVYRSSHNSEHRILAESARRWLFDSVERDGAFDVYCHLIGADPDLIREKVCVAAQTLGQKAKDTIHAARRRPSSSRSLTTAEA